VGGDIFGGAEGDNEVLEGFFWGFFGVFGVGGDEGGEGGSAGGDVGGECCGGG